MKPEEWVYIGGLPFESTEEDVRALFEFPNKILEIHMGTEPQSKRFMGYAVVHLGTQDEVEKALTFLSAQFAGKTRPYALAYNESLGETDI